jgi:hypothetical protein
MANQAMTCLMGDMAKLIWQAHRRFQSRASLEEEILALRPRR